jgi:ATP-dependent RNA helicase RhlB
LYIDIPEYLCITKKDRVSLFRKIVTRIKGLFTKPHTPAAVPPTKEQKPTAFNRKNFPQSKSGEYRLHDPRKRETREEYAARRSKLAQTRSARTIVSSTPVVPTKPATQVKQAVPSKPWDSSVFKIPVVDGKTRFHDLKLVPEIMHAVYDLKFSYCTPVQAETLVKSLVEEDVTAQAQTGTGKTAAYLITIFSHFLKHPIEGKRPMGTPRALILAPTRELVMQIERDARGLGAYIPCGILAVLGGIDYMKQQNALKNDVCDILICTPGRLIDFQRKRLVDLGKVEILVLDEADRMLDMGFIQAVRFIVQSTPPKAKRQTMFFSATMSSEVRRLAELWTRQAFEVNIMPDNLAVESVEQITYITTYNQKPALVYNIIMQKQLDRVLMFVNRRDEARRVKDVLERYGVSCALLSGEVEQQQRIRRLERFREGKVRVLVATDVASRGLHIEGISHVINYNMPQDVEEYVHRIGRTGRAGATGIAINFADEDDAYELVKLEEYLGKKIKCTYPDESLMTPIPELPPRPAKEKTEQSRRPYRRNNSGQGRKPSPK